jgi:hypothetical protein
MGLSARVTQYRIEILDDPGDDVGPAGNVMDAARNAAGHRSVTSELAELLGVDPNAPSETYVEDYIVGIPSRRNRPGRPIPPRGPG